MYPLCMIYFTKNKIFKDHPCLACIRTLLIFMVEKYPILCINHILFIHSSVEEHWSHFHLLTIVILLQWMLERKYLFGSLFSILLSVYLMVILHLIVWEIAKLISMVTVPFNHPMNKSSNFFTCSLTLAVFHILDLPF